MGTGRKSAGFSCNGCRSEQNFAPGEVREMDSVPLHKKGALFPGTNEGFAHWNVDESGMRNIQLVHSGGF